MNILFEIGDSTKTDLVLFWEYTVYNSIATLICMVMNIYCAYLKVNIFYSSSKISIYSYYYSFGLELSNEVYSYLILRNILPQMTTGLPVFLLVGI